MAKRSAFRVFLATVRSDLRSHLPGVSPVVKDLGAGRGMGMRAPKSSTFYAGVSGRLGMHVFINFESSSKAGEVGMFTVNVILSKHEDAPVVLFMLPPANGRAFNAGSCRIGPLVGVNDKWWHLERGSSSMGVAAWRPTRYGNRERVISEAIADVTRDIRTVLDRFAVGGLGTQAKPGATPDIGRNKSYPAEKCDGGEIDLVQRLVERNADRERATTGRIHPRKAVAPVAAKSLQATERAIGFKLPESVRALYLKVGNGGFGPEYGIVGTKGGAKLDGCTLETCYQNLLKLKSSNSIWRWPKRLLPLANYGCGTWCCVDCEYQKLPMILWDPNNLDSDLDGADARLNWGNSFWDKGLSLSTWLEGWLAEKEEPEPNGTAAWGA